MKKKLLYSILILLIAGITGGAIYINTLLPIITGYAAKNLASAVFISHRNQTDVEALDLNFSFIKYTSNKVDTINKRVISRFLWGKSIAIYRDGFGCTLVHGNDEEGLKGIIFPVNAKAVYNQDANPWPMGNILPGQISESAELAGLQTIADKLVDKDAYNGHAFAFVVLHRGIPVVEKYRREFNEKTRFLSWSMAKSFTNTLAGIMVNEGKWDVNQPADIPAWQNDERKNITVNNLLQMKSGLKWNEDYGSGSDVNLMLHRESDFAAYVAGKKLESAPGTDWYYSSGSTNIVSWLIRKKLNSDDAYYRLAYEGLFNRIGMPDAIFEVDASGTFVGSSYIYATARDYARYAMLYLQDGVFNGVRILPEGWVKYTTTPVSGSDGAYGSSFWLNQNKEFPAAPASMYYCKGHDGQRIFIMPDKQLAVIILGYSPKPDNVMDFNKLLGDIRSTIK